MKTFKQFMDEDAPINNVGGGQIAGTKEAGDDPPVRKKKKKIYLGKGSRKYWLQSLKGNGKS
tara:strand:- start:131 stop:316 length:186 start_codon:yes stop_codon:yes gene_type:complete